MQFREAAIGLGIDKLQQITQLHPATLRKYLRTNNAPSHVIRLIAVYGNGHLPSTDARWSGWRLHNNALADPDGNEYQPGEIRSLWAVRQLRAELERLKASPVQFLLDV
ncbi:MAG TPA: hypothetical protein EYG20_10045 [Alcanivorax sp.]|nr:hypothetical protein [Alcanivorax sp.]